MKTPPVSTTVSAIPELIDHEENGLLTEPRDSEATANTLVSLVKNNSEWTAIRRLRPQESDIQI